MSDSCVSHVDDALDELVNQFSDPFSFLRELVQNALDAGSEEVEVDVVFAPGDSEEGIATVLVEDWGEGMTREIIEKKLTRLFSSAKDGDMTKIGKFGIGFVSVFAIEPDAVCIDTSREGNHWRVLFDATRTFRLLRLTDPVDGTKIKIFKSMAEADFEPFKARARSVLSYWCRHTRGEIRFCGELINMPLQLGAPCQVELDDGFSQVIVGHPLDRQPFHGFYNTGLTLVEGTEGYFDRLAFKVSSPHLEHTLSRDSIIRDEGYTRVMSTVMSMAHCALYDETTAKLHEELQRSQPSELRDYFYRAVLWHKMAALPDGIEVPDVAARAVAVSPGGQRLSYRDLRRLPPQGQVLLSVIRSPLTDAAETAGKTVVCARAGSTAAELVATIVPAGVSMLSLHETYCMPVPATDGAENRQWSSLARAVGRLVEGVGGKLSGVEFGHLGYPGSTVGNRVAITQSTFGELTAVADAGGLGAGFWERRRVLVVNADHPAVQPLLGVADAEPEFAAYLLIKLFFVGDRLDEQMDGKLAELTVEHRCRRSIN